MKFRLEFDMDNAAFEGTPGDQAAIILHKLADKMESTPLCLIGVSRCGGNVRDTNGNSVGQWVVTRGGRRKK